MTELGITGYGSYVPQWVSSVLAMVAMSVGEQCTGHGSYQWVSHGHYVPQWVAHGHCRA